MRAKKVVTRQYKAIINQAALVMAHATRPLEGWLRTVRKALSLSGEQLARRIGVTRAQIAKTEKAEIYGNVTMKTLQNMAEAMGCRFVYAIVPERSIDELILAQARKKALSIVQQTNTHMTLEQQSLTSEQIEFEIERLTRDLIERMPSDFWE